MTSAMWCLFWIYRRTKRQIRWNVAFQIVPQNAMNVKTTNDLLLELALFKVYLKLAPNQKWCFCKDVILQLQKYPNLIEVKQTYQRNFSGRNEKRHTKIHSFYFWMRCNCIQSKSDKTKKAAAKPKEEKRRRRIQWRILKLSKTLTTEK
jgi:hypothetical protein